MPKSFDTFARYADSVALRAGMEGWVSFEDAEGYLGILAQTLCQAETRYTGTDDEDGPALNGHLGWDRWCVRQDSRLRA